MKKNITGYNFNCLQRVHSYKEEAGKMTVNLRELAAKYLRAQSCTGKINLVDFLLTKKLTSVGMFQLLWI